MSLISIKPLTPSSLISTGRNSFKLEGREIFYFLSVSGISIFGGFPGGSVVKNPPVNAGGTGLTPGPGRSRREGNGNPLQYPCLETPWTEEPGGLQSMGLQRAGRDLGTKQQQYSIVHI